MHTIKTQIHGLNTNRLEIHYGKDFEMSCNFNTSYSKRVTNLVRFCFSIRTLALFIVLLVELMREITVTFV